MSLSLIALIIFIGLLFIMVEIFLLPGITVGGVVGLVTMTVGIVLAYKDLGTSVGHIALLISFSSSIILFIIGTRTFKSKNVALTKNLENTPAMHLQKIRVGDIGEAHGDIKPTGQAIINGETFQVKSIGDFISDDTEIIVTHIDQNSITVKRK